MGMNNMGMGNASGSMMGDTAGNKDSTGAAAGGHFVEGEHYLGFVESYDIKTGKGYFIVEGIKGHPSTLRDPKSSFVFQLE